MAFVVPALSILSGGAALLGGMQQAQYMTAAGEYQAAVAHNAATVAEDNARRAEVDAETARENARRAGLISQIEAQDQDLSAADQIATVRAEQTASGLSGRTHERVMSSLARLAGRDRARIAEEGRARVSNFQTQAQGFLQEAADLRAGAMTARSDAAMAVANARVDASAARLGGFAGMLQGFTGVSDVLLDGTRRAQVRNDFNNMFRRRPGYGR